MEKTQPPYYTGEPSAPAEGYTAPQGGYPQGGYPQVGYPQGGYPQGGYPQGGYPPQHAEYSCPLTYPQGVYPPQGGYPPQSGYPSQPGYPPHGGYPGYPPQSGPQSIPSAQPGYPPQNQPQPGPVPPPQVIITTTPVVRPQRKRGWCEENQRNKPQSNSQSAASMIFTSGGMSLAWSAGFHPPYTQLSKPAYMHMQVCWFVAIVIGSLLSAILVTKLKKKIFNYLSSILVLVNGILYTSAPDNVTAIVIARYCDGIAFGLSLLPAIVSGSEQSAKGLRGRILSIEQIGLSTGIMLKTIYMNFWGYDWYFNANQMHGILAIVYGAIGLLFTIIFTIESPIFYLRKNEETEATNCLRRLQRPQEVTNETYALLAEDKLVVQEDDVRGRSQNISMGIVPVIKVGLFRAFVAMSFTVPLTWALFLSSMFISDYASEWTTYTYGIMRIIGTFIAICTLDRMGRKVLSAFSLLVGGGLLIGVGSIFSTYWNFTQSDKMDSAVGLLLTYQIFAGIAAPSSTCYLGEAFSISVKPLFIFIAITIENIVQIIIVCTFTNSLSSTSDYAYAVGVLQLLFAIFFFATMPETKNTTLREALAKFKKSLNLGTS